MKIKIEYVNKNSDTNAKLAGVAKIVLNDSIAINNVKIINYNNALFVAMPSVKIKDEYKDVCHPINAALRDQITNAVLNAYNNDVFEEGLSEPFHITDVKAFMINNGKCKAMINLLLNNEFAINFNYLIDNSLPGDKDLNLGFSFQVDSNNVPYVSILSDDLKEEILRKSFDAYKSSYNG